MPSGSIVISKAKATGAEIAIENDDGRIRSSRTQEMVKIGFKVSDRRDFENLIDELVSNGAFVSR